MFRNISVQQVGQAFHVYVVSFSVTFGLIPEVESALTLHSAGPAVWWRSDMAGRVTDICHLERLLMSTSLLACTMQAAYLAEQHSDRATRVAANEFLHAVTLWIVGEPDATLHSASSAYIQHFTDLVQLGMVLALCTLSAF